MSRPFPAAALACRALLCAVGTSTAVPALADPANYVFVPYSTAGARYVAYAAGVANSRDGGRELQQALSVGWSPSARCFTSVYAAWAAQDGGPTTLDEWSWLGHVQLTAPGAAPADVGLLCELARPHDRTQGTGLLCGPTFQVDTDRVQVNLNPWLEKQVGAEESGPVELGYQWQARSLLGPGLELGAQGFGRVGPWDHWLPAAQQEHTVGPAVFYKWMMPNHHALALDAAWLAGVGRGSPRDVLRLRVQHAF